MAKAPSLWIFVAVAAAIATAAFAVGQRFEGLGVFFVVGATFAWTGVAQKLWGLKASG